MDEDYNIESYQKSFTTPTDGSGKGTEPDLGPSVSPPTFSRSSSRANWIGTYKIVVIATEFPDKSATTSISSINTTVNTKMPNYYAEVSYDNFKISSTIVNNSWLMMPHNITYYTENNKAKFGEYITDAIEAADALLDFNQYRTSGSAVSMVILVHTGQDEATSGNPLDIWSHMSQITPKSVDNSYVNRYCTVSEFSPMGTFAHEFGHILGLPDLYDQDYSSDGIGVWGIMASGSHLNGGNTPGHFSAWSKSYLGWLTPTVVDSNLYDQAVIGVEENAVAFKVPIPITDANSDEYFLIENRRKTGYDAYLPASGLVIWHVDEAKLTSFAPNDDENHKMLDVEENTPTQNLDVRSDGNIGDSTDVWSSNPTGFTPASDPNSDSYYGTSSKFYLEDISASSSTMTADFIVRHVYAEVQGNSNKYADPGTDIIVKFNVSSDRASGDTLDITLDGTTHIDWISLNTLGVSLSAESDIGTVEVTVSIPPGEFPNNFCEFSIHVTSSDDTEGDSNNVKVLVSQFYTFRATRPSDVALDPGNGVITKFTLFNEGNAKHTFSITLDNPKSTWKAVLWNAGDTSPELKPYSNKTVDIFIELPLNVNSDEKAVITVTIVSQANSETVDLEFNVTVNKIYGLKLQSSVSGKRIDVDAGADLEYPFKLTAEGNTKDTVSISSGYVVKEGSEDTPWTYNIEPGSELMLNSGEETEFTIKITVPEKARAGLHLRFTVMVFSEDGVTNETLWFELIVRQDYGMTAVLDSFTDTVKPGEDVIFNFKITNTGNGNDTYNITLLTNLPEDWALKYPSIADDEVTPDSTVKYQIILITTSHTPAATIEFKFRLKSMGNTSLTETVTEEIDVERVHLVTLTKITDETLTGGASNILNFTVMVENMGNDAETIQFSTNQVAHGLVTFKSSVQGGPITSLTLKVGESKSIIVVLSLWSTLDDDENGAVQLKGTLGEGSFTNEVLLYYKVNAGDTGDGTPADGDQSTVKETGGLLDSGLTLILIILVVVIVLVVAVIWFFVIKKGRSKSQKTEVATPVQAEIVTIDPVTGFPVQNGYMAVNGISRPETRYDPVTGQPQYPEMAGGQMAMEAPLRFDPQTGEPFSPEPQQAEMGTTAPMRFDPETGEPLAPGLPPGDNPPEVPMRFDPQTGEPLTEEMVEGEILEGEIFEEPAEWEYGQRAKREE